MSVKFSNPKGVSTPAGQYSHAAKITFNSDLLFISGQGPQNEDGKTVGVGDMTAQAEQVFRNLKTILEGHKSSFAKTIKATIYITDMSLLGEFNAVRAKYYGDAKPASALVEVNALVDPDWMLEVELIALA